MNEGTRFFLNFAYGNDHLKTQFRRAATTYVLTFTLQRPGKTHC